jgi:hypothetical protein
MLVHSGELVQVIPAEETFRIMDMFKYQPVFPELSKENENRPSGESPNTVYNIFKNDEEEEEEFPGTVKTTGSITGAYSQRRTEGRKAVLSSVIFPKN